MTPLSPLALILALLSAVCAGLVGAFAVMRKMSLAGDAISHIALPGLGIAYLLGFHPLAGAAVTLLLGAVLIWRLEASAGLDPETAVGVVFSASLAVGALMTPREDLVEALFGAFKRPSWPEFAGGVLVSVVVLAVVERFRDRFALALFSPDLAASVGVKTRKVELVFLLTFAATVLLSLRFLGALLAGALVIIPAAIARTLTSRFRLFVTLSATMSVLCVVLGTAAAQALRLEEGPTIVTLAALLFGLATALRPRRAR